VIDGIQPLPLEYMPPDGPPVWTGSETDPSIYDKKLVESFGPVCMELQRPLRLWLPDKGIVFATGEFSIDKDGRVRLSPFSAALYHKNQTPSKVPEISTVRCDVALLTLDRPVSTFGELNNRQDYRHRTAGPKRAALHHHYHNRRTAEKNDDIDIRITTVRSIIARAETGLDRGDGVRDGLPDQAADGDQRSRHGHAPRQGHGPERAAQREENQ